MSFYGQRRGSGEDDEGWEVITADWWHTPFTSVSWAYVVQQDPPDNKTAQQRQFRGPLFPGRSLGRRSHLDERRPTSTERDVDTSLNEDLAGVQCALEAVTEYEKDVGFDFEAFPQLTPNELDPSATVDVLTRRIEEEELKANKEKWDELLEDLMHSPVVSETTDSDDSLESSLSSLGDLLHRCVSTLSSIASDGSIDSVMPSTPKAKSAYLSVDIKEASPSGSTDLSPGRSLNASASSFVPSFNTHDVEPLHFPSLRDSPSPFATFTFPTLNASAPAPLVKIKKDEQGFFTELQSPDSSSSADTGLLPPFLQEPAQRNRNRKSRTREIVDRLRSQVVPGDIGNANLSTISPKYASHSSSPMMEDLGSSFMRPRRSVSEDGGGDSRASALSTPSPCEDEDGWIDVAHPSASASPSGKAKRTRELFLALTRRRTDSLSSETWKELIGAENLDGVNAETSSPSPMGKTPPHLPAAPLLSSDGWIESSISPSGAKVDPLPKAQKASKNHASSKDSHNRKKSSISHPPKNPSAWSHASTSSSSRQHHPFHPSQHTFAAPPSAAAFPTHHPQLSYPHAHAQHYPHHAHTVPISVAQMPYFVPAYSAVAMPVAYPAAFGVMHPAHAMPGYPISTHMAMQSGPYTSATGSGVSTTANYSVRHSSGGVLVSTNGLGSASMAGAAPAETRVIPTVQW